MLEWIEFILLRLIKRTRRTTGRLFLALSFFSIPGAAQEKGAASTIPFERSPAGHVIASVQLTTATRSLANKRAILDTGAGGSVIDAALVEPEDCHAFTAEVTDARGVNQDYPKAAWISVQVGLAAPVKVRFIVMDLSSKAPKEFGRVDLILGWEVFKGRTLGFNLRDNQLLTAPIRQPDLDVPIEWTEDHLPALSGTLNQCTIKWVLDTGGKFAATIPASSTACASKRSGEGSVYSSINGGTSPVQSSLSNLIKVGSTTWGDQVVWITSDSTASLGLRFFDHCEVEFDFQSNRFRARKLPN